MHGHCEFCLMAAKPTLQELSVQSGCVLLQTQPNRCTCGPYAVWQHATHACGTCVYLSASMRVPDL